MKLWIPQQLYDEAIDLGFAGYPRAIEVERAAYDAALSFQEGRADRCLTLAEQLAYKQRDFYSNSAELSPDRSKPRGSKIKRRLTGD